LTAFPLPAFYVINGAVLEAKAAFRDGLVRAAEGGAGAWCESVVSFLGACVWICVP
jgi:hypothetical protein